MDKVMFQTDRRLNLKIIFAALLAAGAGALARQTTQPSTQSAATHPSTVLEPVVEGTTKPSDNPATQFGDGLLLVDLVGRLEHEKNGDATFVFQFGGKTLRIKILPDTLLAQMESAAESNPSLRFRLTGRTTAYRGHNFLLVQDAVIVPDEP